MAEPNTDKTLRAPQGSPPAYGHEPERGRARSPAPRWLSAEPIPEREPTPEPAPSLFAPASAPRQPIPTPEPEPQSNPDAMRARKGAANLEALRAFGLFTQLGLSMAACALVGVLAGSRLDKWLRTSPWMLLLFSFLGVAAAFKAMYDIVIKRWSKK